MPLVKQRVLQAMHEVPFAGPKALAVAAGVDPSTIHRLGQKGPPDMKTLEGIARVTGKSVDWLMGRPEQVPTPDLAAALIALSEELRLSRESRAALEREVAALRQVVDGLVEQALQGAPAPAAQHRTTG